MINEFVKKIYIKNEELLIDKYNLKSDTDKIELKRKMMILSSKLYIFYEPHKEIMELCNKKNYDTIAMAIAYKAIDNFSWLYLYPNEDKTPAKIFIDFTDSFLMMYIEDMINSEELWSSRCGTLHQNTYESFHTKKNKTKFVVLYSNKKINREELLQNVNTRDYSEDQYCFLRMDYFFKAIDKAVDEFYEYIVINKRIDEILYKIDKMPLWYMFIDV